MLGKIDYKNGRVRKREKLGLSLWITFGTVFFFVCSDCCCFCCFTHTNSNICLSAWIIFIYSIWNWIYFLLPFSFHIRKCLPFSFMHTGLFVNHHHHQSSLLIVVSAKRDTKKNVNKPFMRNQRCSNVYICFMWWFQWWWLNDWMNDKKNDFKKKNFKWWQLFSDLKIQSECLKRNHNQTIMMMMTMVMMFKLIEFNIYIGKTKNTLWFWNKQSHYPWW